MNKAYLLVICLLLTSLTGCLDDDEDSYLEECETEYDNYYECNECNELVPYGDCSSLTYTEDYSQLSYDLSGQDLSGMNLTGIDFSYTDLTGVNLSYADLTDAKLNQVELRGANLNGANLNGANLSHVHAINLEGCPAQLPYDWQCLGDDLVGPSANLNYADLAGADLSYTDLSTVYFEYANLTGANLTGAILFKAHLSYADLTGANLRYACVLCEQLNGSSYWGVESYLTYINLTARYEVCCNAFFFDTNFRSADLSYANLAGTTLVGADLSYANLTGANLYNTILDKVDFTGAIVTNANFKDTEWYYTTWTDGEIYYTNQAKEVTEEETQDYDMTVTDVIDGDTFYLGNGDKVRMLGMNTPESGRPYSQEATDFLTNMILGKEVSLVNDSKNGDSDSYGRLLAHVYVDDTFVNYEIIKAGFAFWYPYTSGTDFDSEYEEAQDYASNNMAGLWTESSYNLTIDYIEYDPEGDEAEGEYVVLTNHENYNVSMVGWFLQDEAAQTAYEFDFIITNNTSIRIYTGDGTDNATTLFWGWHQGIWNNSGDFAIIQDENGYMVDSYRYD